MSNLIQIKRGTESAVDAYTPVAGELVYTTDSKRVRVGDGATAGGIAIGLWNNIGATDDIYYSLGDVHVGASTDPDETFQVTGNVKVVGQAYSAQVTDTVSGTTLAAVDFDDGNSHIVDLASASGDVTITAFSNGKAGASYLLKVLQGATARDVTWPGTVVWLGNEPTLTNDASGFNVLGAIHLSRVSCRAL
jgi:hypothetical protein